MIRAIIWGLGKEFNRSFNLIQYQEKIGKLQVLGITAIDKEYSVCGNYIYIEPCMIHNCTYDIIFVTSEIHYSSIVNSGREYGVSEESFAPIRILEIPLIDLDKYMQLKKSNLSIVSQNCWGGLTYNYLGLKFMSPFINLSLSEIDMLKLMADFDSYMNYKVFYKTSVYNERLKRYYPIGLLRDIEIRFVHYTDFEDAVIKWEERKNRINYDNLLFMAYTEDIDFVNRFMKLDCHKICFVPFEHQDNCIVSLKTIDNQMPFWETVTSSATGKRYNYNTVDLLLDLSQKIKP